MAGRNSPPPIKDTILQNTDRAMRYIHTHPCGWWWTQCDVRLATGTEFFMMIIHSSNSAA